MAHLCVLIVEDDADIRETMASVLAEEGHTVATAEDGVKALELLRGADSPKPSLIVLDLMMPNMDGWEFHRELRKDQRIAKIPVAVLSGDPSTVEKTVSLTIVAAMKKPISLDTLDGVITRFCGRASH